ncbi:calphotin-like isoform X2 [Dreissena polymorpha]|uniref:calphotin-like isoform X2 n=1 Tax=Dreissena polymorpha TaxID=45954 RepID=UPI002264E0FF|nr:calphotin-like isoform X2 [Dreissena polymorpha]
MDLTSTGTILVGSRYQVQWGNARQVTQAVVLATGAQNDMKAREAQNPSVAVAAPAAQSTKPPVKRPRVQKNEKGKELARMVAVGQGQVAAPIGPEGVPAPVAVALPATVSLIVPAPTTPSGPSVEVPVTVAPSLPVTAPAPSVPAPTTPSGPSVEVPVAVLMYARHVTAPSDSTTPSVQVSEEVPGTTPTIRRPTIRIQRQSDDTVAAVLTGVQALLVAQNTKFSKRFDAQAMMIQDLHSEVRDLCHQVHALQTLYHRAVSSEPSPPQETVVDF